LTIAPWLIRNSLLHHKLTGIELDGYNLYLGYHPKGNGSIVWSTWIAYESSMMARDKVALRKPLICDEEANYE